MNMRMMLDVELELVTAVGGDVPTRARGHSHHLLFLAVGQVGQELSLLLLPGRAVGHTQPLPLLGEGVGKVTYLLNIVHGCQYAAISSVLLFMSYESVLVVK